MSKYTARVFVSAPSGNYFFDVSMDRESVRQTALTAWNTTPEYRGKVEKIRVRQLGTKRWYVFSREKLAELAK